MSTMCMSESQIISVQLSLVMMKINTHDFV